MATRVILDKQALDKVLRSADGPVMRDTTKRAYRVHRRAAEECPVDEGRLRSSLQVRFGRDARGPFALVGTDVEYALFVHEGTKPHTIRPRTARVLVFPSSGSPGRGHGTRTAPLVFAREVRHPGTKPRPFLRNALEEVRR